MCPNRGKIWCVVYYSMKDEEERKREKHQVIELKLKVWPGGWERLCITHANRDNRDNDLHLNLCQLLRPDREDGVYGVISELYKPLLDRSHLDEPWSPVSASGLGITFFLIFYVAVCCLSTSSSFRKLTAILTVSKDVVMWALQVNVTNTYFSKHWTFFLVFLPFWLRVTDDVFWHYNLLSFWLKLVLVGHSLRQLLVLYRMHF